MIYGHQVCGMVEVICQKNVILSWNIVICELSYFSFFLPPHITVPFWQISAFLCYILIPLKPCLISKVIIVNTTPLRWASAQEVTFTPIWHKANNTNTGETEFEPTQTDETKEDGKIMGSMCREERRSSSHVFLSGFSIPTTSFDWIRTLLRSDFFQILIFMYAWSNQRSFFKQKVGF